jgi:hypothetical protein
MAFEFESTVLCNSRHAHGQYFFDFSGNVHVENQSTTDTHEVVVMTLQFLGEFERRSVSVRENLDDDACSLEDRQVSIHAALGQIGIEGDDVRGSHWMGRLHECIDKPSPTR